LGESQNIGNMILGISIDFVRGEFIDRNMRSNNDNIFSCKGGTTSLKLYKDMTSHKVNTNPEACVASVNNGFST